MLTKVQLKIQKIHYQLEKGNFDKPVIPILDKLNSIKGICTLSSCVGHYKKTENSLHEARGWYTHSCFLNIGYGRGMKKPLKDFMLMVERRLSILGDTTFLHDTFYANESHFGLDFERSNTITMYCLSLPDVPTEEYNKSLDDKFTTLRNKFWEVFEETLDDYKYIFEEVGFKEKR